MQIFTIRLLMLITFYFSFSWPFYIYAQQLNFASIEGLSEQEVARIVLPQLYQKIGLNISISPLPASRAQYEANSGIKDGEILRIYSYGEENKNVIRVPTPYYSLTTAVFTLKDSNINIKNTTDLASYRVGKVRGVKHTENATKDLPRVFNNRNTQQLFKQLKQGIIDIALTNHLNGLLMIKKLGKDNFKVVNEAIAVEPLYHYISQKNQSMVGPIDKIIKEVTASGELTQMLKKAEAKVY